MGTWPGFQCQQTANTGEKCGVAQGQEVYPQGSSKSPEPGCCQLHNWQKCPHRPGMGRDINNHAQEAVPARPRAGLALTGRWRHLPSATSTDACGLERNTAASGCKWVLSTTWPTAGRAWWRHYVHQDSALEDLSGCCLKGGCIARSRATIPFHDPSGIRSDLGGASSA